MKKFIIILLIITIGIYLYIGNNNKINMNMASKVEKNLYRTGGPIKITEDFDGYFLMNDYESSKIPVLFSLSFDYSDIENGKISDSIRSFETKFIGTNRKFQIDNNEDNKYYFTLFYNSKFNGEGETKLKGARSQEHEIAFLKKNFKDDIDIKEVNKDQIIYTTNK